MTTNDDLDDPVMDWALGERLGGEAPRDLVDGVRERLAASGAPAPFAKRGLGAQLWAAAIVLLGVLVVLGVAVWPRGSGIGVPIHEPAQKPAQQEPKPAQVYSLADAAALQATTRAVEVIDGDDAVIATLKRLRDLEVLIVREPFHENCGLGLKRPPPTDPKHVTAAAWPDLLSFTKLRTLELSGTLLLGRVRPDDIADGLERLPLLSTLALRFLDTDTQVLGVLPRIRGLQCLDLAYNHGFDGGWIEPVLKCRSLVSLRLDGCQQVRGDELARLGELPLLEELKAANIDGMNWRNSASFLDDVERQVIVRAQRLTESAGTGPTDEALAGIARCAKLRVLDIAGGHWTAAGLAELGACADLKVLDAFGGGNKDHSFVASLPAGLERLEVCGDYTDAFCAAVAAHLKSLRHLTIAACYQITDRGLAEVAAMPSLRILDMRQMRGLTVATIDTLLAAKQLEDLDVRHCDFVTAQHVVQLRRALPRLQHLETSVDPAAITAAEREAPAKDAPAPMPVPSPNRPPVLEANGNAQLARFMELLKETMERRRAGQEQTESGLQQGERPERVTCSCKEDVERLPATTCAVEGVELDDAGIAALSRLRSLERLVLRPRKPETVPLPTRLTEPPVAPMTDAGMRAIAAMPTLRALRLDRARQVTPDGLALLAQLPLLEELELAVMEVPDAFFARLAGSPLKRLRLEGCRGFGAAGVDSIVRMRELRDVAFPFCGHMEEAWLERLAGLPKLERLDLSYIGSRTVFSGLSEFGSHVEPGSGVTARVLIALGNSATLRDLDVGYGAVDAAGLRGLRAAPALASLDLSGTQVRAAELAALPRALVRLALRNCRELEQDFGKTLVQATPGLRELVLAHTDSLRDECLPPLQGLRSLRALDLSRCAGMTAAAVDRLAAITQLEEFTVRGCVWLEAGGLAKLRAMPNLKVLETDNGREILRK